MKINTYMKETLVNELRLVVRKMKEETDIRRKNYFFSATYGAVYRIFNINFDPELVLVHSVLNMTYRTANALLGGIDRGEERIIQIPDNFFDKLASLTEELATAIEEDKDVYGILQKIAVLSYSLTGNGYYLYQKGLIEI
jgi:hypothetical protein